MESCSKTIVNDRQRHHYRDACRSIIALFFCAATALADDAYHPLEHLWEGVRDIPNTESVIVLSVGSAATLGALAFDNTVKNFFSSRERIGSAKNIGNFWGTGIPEVSIGVGQVGYGLAFRSRTGLNAGEANLEGLLATAVATYALKYSVRRTRPSGSSRTSFPSGHTSTSFALAANMMDMYGPWVGAPALTLGAFSGVSRLDSNMHYLSDVLFGATLGYAVGHAYTIHHKPKADATTVAVMPFYESMQAMGLDVEVLF